MALFKLVFFHIKSQDLIMRSWRKIVYLSTNRLLARKLARLPMSHNEKLHIDQQHVLGLLQNSHHLSMKLIIGNVRCIDR